MIVVSFCNIVVIRRYRENLSRKCSFEDNVVDIFVRLASESDPVLNQFRSKLVCEKCGEHGHTKGAKCCTNNLSLSSIDTIVDSLIINTWNYGISIILVHVCCHHHYEP